MFTDSLHLIYVIVYLYRTQLFALRKQNKETKACFHSHTARDFIYCVMTKATIKLDEIIFRELSTHS